MTAIDPLNLNIPDCTLSSTLSRTPRGFTITTDSYISLIPRVYAAYCSKYEEFADKISESAFQCYAVFLLWERLAEFLPSSMKRESLFLEELKQIPHHTYFIPKLLLSYLKGIGHFRDAYSADRQFLLPIFPSYDEIEGIRYSFGKVNAKTHFLYETFPAPAILILRMLADIEYTTDICQKNLFWNLPDGLRPDVLESRVESCLPTTNLLGWAPAQILTKNQLQFFETCKIQEITNNGFKSLSQTLINMFKEISCLMEEHDSCYCTVWSSPFGLKGTVLQGLTVKKLDEYNKFDRSAMYCEGSLSVCSAFNSSDQHNKSAIIYGYRMAKEPIGNRHCWSCYNFDEYKSVPESWIRSRNKIYLYGSVAGLNETIYNTGYINKKVVQNNWIQHAMFKSAPSVWDLYS